ncbi:MAG: hypothetical protein IPL94_03555 [Tetrasphaera sp.]|nr:hypothetical protein [Tetrasphaera sp.]
MRWDALFDDLEGRFEAEERLDRDAEIADRTRQERGAVALLTRVAAHRGVLRVRLMTGSAIEGTVADLGSDWLLLQSPDGHRELLVPISAVLAIEGLGPRSALARTARRFPLRSALRGIARDRTPIRLHDLAGSVTTGTLDVVGADFVDVAAHALDEARRTPNVLAQVTIPLAAIALVEGRA